MLPVFTTHQVKDGVDSGDLLIDLSEYMKKKEGATKVELDSLTAVVANKLDATPQHKHHISDIKQLESALAGKFDTSQRYSYQEILSNTEEIAFIESPRMTMLELSADKDSVGYRFYVDSSNGDLMVVSVDDILIASYSTASRSWNFGGVLLKDIVNIDDVNGAIETMRTDVNTVLENHSEALNAVCGATLVNITDIAANNSKITTVETLINDYIAKTDAVLKNHYDALLELCQKHGMIDGTENDGSKISPE